MPTRFGNIPVTTIIGPGLLYTPGAPPTLSATAPAPVGLSTIDGLVATGTTQATALALSHVVNIFSTVPPSSGALLQTIANTVFWVGNDGANALALYPNTGTNFFGLAENIPITVPANGAVTVILIGIVWNVLAIGNDARITDSEILIDVGTPSAAFRITVGPFRRAHSIAANVVWGAHCQANPGSTMTIPWIVNISGAPTTVNLSLSTGGAITNPGSGAYAFAAGDFFTLDIPFDAAAVAIGLGVLSSK